MTDLEQRVRDELAALAGELPPSRGGWAEQRRRLERRRRSRWRVPMLAAAATVLAAGIAVPILSTRPDTTGAGTDRTSATSGPTGVSGAPVVPTVAPTAAADPTGPVAGTALPPPTADRRVVAEFTEAGVRWQALAYTRRHRTDGDETLQVCVVGVPVGQSVDGPTLHPNSDCRGPFVWPAGQHQPLVHTRPVLWGAELDSGPTPHLMVFVTRPVVATLTVRDSPGAPVPVRELERTDTVVLFLADFGDSSQGFGYTAYDAAGAAVESAIT